MFVYWDGFEIDGSDTDFNIVLPENVQLLEFVDCFLSIPIFSGSMEPQITYFKDKQHTLRIDALRDLLLAGNFPDICIDINCLHIEQLSDELRAKIYAISERREPHEDAFGKVEHPCTGPVIQNYYTRGEMTVGLYIRMPDKTESRMEEDIEGYVNNMELIRSAQQGLYCFRINVGPSFYYEYAMYIVDYLRDRFPGLGTWGGLDCEGGWTDGCTYANSIYWYEKIQIPLTCSAKDMLKRLAEHQIVRSHKTYYNAKWKWHCEYSDGYYLATHAPALADVEKEFHPVSFDEYADLVDSALEMGSDTFTTVCVTAAQIILPKAEEYAARPKIVRLLQKTLPKIEQTHHDGYFTGYLAFTRVGDKPVCEFRVHYSMKKYFLTLLKLMDHA
ncbi:MAG: hypothetical protein FWF10_01375 [Clostridiales bacterium]|nr:hypothetical protein [Clostridiales bacterium]